MCCHCYFSLFTCRADHLQIDHRLCRSSRSFSAVRIPCAGSVSYTSNPGNMSYKSRSLEALQVPRGSMIYLGNTNQDFICPDISNAGMIYLIYRRCRLFEARSLGTITSRVHSQSRNRYKVPGRTSKCIQYVLRLETLVSSMHYCFSVVFNGSFWCC